MKQLSIKERKINKGTNWNNKFLQNWAKLFSYIKKKTERAVLECVHAPQTRKLRREREGAAEQLQRKTIDEKMNQDEACKKIQKS